jgi:alpha-ketoglutarate-dependent taurine dioxygenase
MSANSTRPVLRIVKRGERESMSVSTQGLCRFEPLMEDAELPWLVHPTVPDLDLPAWLRNNRDLVGTQLREHGALLFRGFEVRGAERFQDCVKAISGDLLEYEYRSTPRTRVSGSIYTSTEYPPSRSIPLHNEMSYARAWPLKIWFYAVRVAASGGQTPLADSRKVLARLSQKVRDTFAEREVMSTSNASAARSACPSSGWTATG